MRSSVEDGVPPPVSPKISRNRGMKERHQSVISDITAKITACYMPVLKRAYDLAWDIKVPTQAVVDGLTIRVQKFISDLKHSFNEDVTRNGERLINKNDEIVILLDRFKHLTAQDDDAKKPEPQLVPWDAHKIPFDGKE